MNPLALLPWVLAHMSMLALASLRIGVFASGFMFFTSAYINKRILIALIILLSVWVVMLLPMPAQIATLPPSEMVVAGAYQVILGLLLALTFNVIFEVFTAFGQIVSSSIGLMMASMIDPALGNIATLTRFYYFCYLMIFLLLNGHLYVLRTVLESFVWFPLGQSVLPHALLQHIFNFFCIILPQAVLLAITVMIATLLTNCAMALMTRLAPQFNVFSVGIGLTILFGFICVLITFQPALIQGQTFMRAALIQAHDIFSGGRLHGR